MMWRHLQLLPMILVIGTVQAETATIERLDNSLSIIVYEPEPEVGKEASIEAYRKLLDSLPDPKLRRQVMRRIADQQLALFREHLKYRHDRSDYHLDKARNLYNDFLHTYPGDPDGDDILYNLAHAYDDAGRDDDTLATLQRLIDTYPGSPYRDEAQFRRGEIFFELREFPQAAIVYEAISRQKPPSPFQVEANYKLGWTLFSMGDYEPALDALFMVLDDKLAPGGRFVKGESLRALASEDQALVQDTMRAINMSFSYLEETQAIKAYLGQRRQRPYDDLIYEALAQRYLAKQRYTDAAGAYAGFVELNPDHPEAPYYQIKVYETYENAGFRSLAWTAKQDFIDRYGFNSPFWLSHDIREYPAISISLKKNLMELAQHYHANAQASGDPADFAAVASMYRNYLSLFPEDPESPRLNFLLAELLNEGGRTREAIEEYERAAYGYRKHEQAAEAGYAALTLRDALLRKVPASRQTAAHQERIAIALKFTTHFPEHPQTAAVLVRTAEDLFADGDYDRALALAERALQRTPPAGDHLRLSSWTIQGHIYFDLEQYADAARAYEAALLLTGDRDARRPALEERLAASFYKQAEAARARGDTEQMIAYFLRVPSVSRQSDITATALYDAGAALISLQAWERAIQTLERFRADFPGHHWQADVSRKLAHAYRQSGHSIKAADEYLEIGMRSSDILLKKEALRQAAELYEKEGEITQATTAYKHYVEAFPFPLDQAQQVRMRLVALSEQEGYSHQQRYWMNKIIEADEMAGAASTPYSHELAANAALKLAQPIHQVYRGIRLVTPLEKSLRTKKRAMESALEAYGRAIDYNIAEVTTAATYHIGEIYHDLSRSLLDSQRPPGLSRDEREQYDILLEEEAYPFEEEAIKLHESNVDNIRQGIYDNWVKASIERLAELLPARYDKSEKRVNFVKTIN